MEDSARNTSQTLSVLNFLFGVWLIISPYVLGYTTGQAKWQQTIAGIIIAVLALVKFGLPSLKWPSWINAIVGLWMIIAPFATNYGSGVAYWNEVIFGILVIIVSLWNASLNPTRVYHGSSHGRPV